MSEINGRDQGDLRKYRTEIPNVVFTLGLDPYALALYCHLKRTTGAADGGLCWKSTRTLAEETKMSVGKVSEARAELEKPREELRGKALIAVDRPKERGRATEVICLDVWLENFAHFLGASCSCGEHACSCGERKKEPFEEKTTTTREETESEILENVTALGDVASQCLLALSRVEGFPRDWPKTALYLAELREEFPNVDAVEVVRQYEVWHRDNPGKTKNYRGRLRSFFKRAAQDAGKSGAITTTSKTATPEIAINAIRAHDSVKGYTSVAKLWDFTSEEVPDWRILSQIGGPPDEQNKNLKRLQRVARKAMSGEAI